MECLFCKIAKKETNSYIIYEDDKFIAFLDVNPRSRGMCLVTPKQHVLCLEEDLEISKKMFELSIKISEAIKKALSPLAISIAYYPSPLSHIHLRIYPFFQDEIPLIENQPKTVSSEELNRIAEAIRKNINIRDVVEEKKEEKDSENEIISRRKRDWLIA